MKKLIKFLVVLLILSAVAVSACDGGGEKQTVTEVTALTNTVTLKDSEVEGYDFTPYFAITVDGAAVDVLPSYINSAAVKAQAGSYPVVCAYGGKEATLTATVTQTEYSVELDIEGGEITLYGYQVETYDFLSHFKAYTDGQEVPITTDMISNGVKAEAGDYEYTVSHGGASKTLTVHVPSAHKVDIVNTYAHIEIPLSEAASFDCRQLFAIYSDGVAVAVTDEMIDGSALHAAQKTGTYAVTIDVDGAHKSAEVEVVEDAEIVLTAKDVTTYPNGGALDLTQLFTIMRGGEVIPVTIDMIQGSVDYSKEGQNTITLTYGGKSATAVVTVVTGVVISYARGEVVTVKAGTDMATYSFADDFLVIINGLRFRDIPNSCFDFGQLDFDTPGSYTVTLTISYGSKAPNGWGEFGSPDEFTKSITYNVISDTITLTVLSDPYIVDGTDKNFDPLSNLRLTVNGVVRGITANPEYVGRYTYLATVINDLDYNSLDDQTIVVDVFADGENRQAIRISYTAKIKADVTITPRNMAVFSGSTLFTTDLFTITENGKPVEVTYDMLCGKVDTFECGKYFVTAEYKGASATASVAVLDRSMIGLYRTLMTAMPEEEEDDDEYEEGWGGSGEGGYYSLTDGVAAAAETAPRLGSLMIEEDGSIVFNQREVTAVEGLDGSTLYVTVGQNSYYTLYYYDGIAVLDPDNYLKSKFSDYTRPIVYFHRDMWELTDSITIDSSSKYVIAADTLGTYSVDAFNAVNTQTGEELWFALKVRIAENSGGNTRYVVEWGECTFSQNFTNSAGEEATLTLNGEEYNFTVTEAGHGSFATLDKNAPFINKTFSGMVNGVMATLTINSQNILSLTASDGTKIVERGELNAMPNGGNMGDGKFLIYSHGKDEVYSYLFQTEGSTFTILPRDKYYGKYVFGNKYIFLDGFGTGHINFNSASFSTTTLKYSFVSGEIVIEYTGTLPGYEYGEGATFYLSPLLNVLTVKSINHPEIPVGSEFENSVLTDGAIVKVASLRYPTAETPPSDIISRFAENITIITPHGELEGKAKLDCINATTINWRAAGFYKFTITVPVEGQNVVLPYTVEILRPQYAGNAYLGLYTSVTYGATVNIDAYGRGTITYGTAVYSGTAQIFEDGSFIIKAHSAEGVYACAQGKSITEGVMLITLSGRAFEPSVCDHFVMNNVTVAQAGGSVEGQTHIIRSFTRGGQTVYVHYSTTPSAEIVTLEPVSDKTYTVKTLSGETVGTFAITWGDLKSGITAA